MPNLMCHDFRYRGCSSSGSARVEKQQAVAPRQHKPWPKACRIRAE